MTDQEARPAPEPESPAGRVDARLLASGTLPRFILLLLLLAGGGVTVLARMATNRLSAGPERADLCLLASGHDPDLDLIANATRTTRRTTAAIDSCQADLWATQHRWILVSTGLLVGLALVTYWWLPVWRTRRRRLVPVGSLALPGLGEQLRALAGSAGLPRTPAFVVDPAAETTSAVTFGRFRRYTVCLHGGLVTRWRADPAGVRAVVRHELAHIRNRDVDLTYAAVALWRVYLVVVLAPALLLTLHPQLGRGPLSASVALWRAHWSTGLRTLVELATLALLVQLAQRDILRTRELYADLDTGDDATAARGWWRHTDRSGPGAALRGLWRSHPRWAERERTLADPAPLFGVAALPMFLTGVAAILVSHQLTLLATGTTAARAIGTAGVWLTATLVTAIAGTALWRAAAHAVLTGRPGPSGVRAGLWLGAGLALGELLSFRVTTGWLPRRPEFTLALVVGAAVLCWWISQAAELWVRATRGRSLRPTHLAGLAVCLLVVGGWFAYWSQATVVLTGGAIDRLEHAASVLLAEDLPGARHVPPGFVAGFTLALHLRERVTQVGAVVLWLFPLAAWLRGPARTGPRWTGGRAAHLPPLRPALRAAAIGGAVATTGTVVVMLLFHRVRPPAGQRGAALLLGVEAWQVVVAGAAMAATAGVLAGVLRRQRLSLALVAAAGVGLVALTGSFLLGTTDGCVTPLEVMADRCAAKPDPAWSTIRLTGPLLFGPGMYLAALAALGGAGLAGVSARLRRRRESARGAEPLDTGAPAGRRLPPAGRLGLATGCLVVATALVADALVAGVGQGSSRPDRFAELVVVDAPPPRADVRRSQVRAWLAVGGGELFDGFTDDLAAVVDLLGKVDDQQSEHAPVHPAGTGFAPVCASVSRHVDRAGAFFPIPDPASDEGWTAALTSLSRGAADCLRAVERDDGALFMTALDELTAGYGELTRSRVALAGIVG